MWFAWFAYVRWTTPPAAVARGGSVAQTRSEASEALEAALSNLPSFVPTRTAPARGWGGPFQAKRLLEEALKGEWASLPSAEHTQILSYISSAHVEQALRDIDAACRQVRHAARGDASSGPRPRAVLLRWNKLIQAANAIAARTVRARREFAERSDPAAALHELRAALRLKAIVVLSDDWGVILSRPDATQYELLCMTREVDLPRDLAGEMIAFLRDERLLWVSRSVSRKVGLAGRVQAFVDRYYTDDGTGRGWLVLSAASDQIPRSLAMRTGPRGRFWNLFSPLFNDRETVTRRLAALQRNIERLDELDYFSGRQLVVTGGYRRSGSVLNGPLAGVSGGINSVDYDTLFGDIAHNRAAVVMLALSAYKNEHGRYPHTLEALQPDYIDEIPLEAFTHERFVYEAENDGSYVLRPSRRLADELREPPWVGRVRFPTDKFTVSRMPHGQ